MRSWSILTRPLNLHSRSIVAACLPATAGVHIERACEIGHVGATAVAERWWVLLKIPRCDIDGVSEGKC